MMGITFREAMEIAQYYAKGVGASVKVEGDYAWRSPRFNEDKGIGRWIRFICIKGEFVEAYDSKEGHIRLCKLPRGGKSGKARE